MTDDRSTSEILAGEYALGLLTGDNLRSARERIASDAGFARDVARWTGRLASLHDEIQSVEPPRDVWERIAATLGLGPANDNESSYRRQLLAWKSFAGAMTAVAASLALFLVIEPRTKPVSIDSPARQQAQAPMVAILGGEGSLKVVASWNPAARQLVLAVPGEIRTDRSHSNELWVIPAGGKPKSLGTMPDAKQMHMQLGNALATLLQDGATIAISVEPLGGSPTGAPTGPVVASGALAPA